jgi:hypothetical protein
LGDLVIRANGRHRRIVDPCNHNNKDRDQKHEHQSKFESSPEFKSSRVFVEWSHGRTYRLPLAGGGNP